MKLSRTPILPLFLVAATVIPATFVPAPLHAEKASVATIEPEGLRESEQFPGPVAALVETALGLTERKLYYRFGSNSPDLGGMDCSGAVQCALGSVGIEGLPRSSYGFYQWAKEEGTLVPTPGVTSTDDPAFEDLRPGDLLFWQGTYTTGDRDPPISHVMIYLGTLEEDGRGVVFGASDGRRFRGKRINGVSVFDWKVPSAGSKSKFVGYARVPGLAESAGHESEAAGESGETGTDDPAGKARPLKSALEKLFRRREPQTP